NGKRLELLRSKLESAAPSACTATGQAPSEASPGTVILPLNLPSASATNGRAFSVSPAADNVTFWPALKPVPATSTVSPAWVSGVVARTVGPAEPRPGACATAVPAALARTRASSTVRRTLPGDF